MSNCSENGSNSSRTRLYFTEGTGPWLIKVSFLPWISHRHMGTHIIYTNPEILSHIWVFFFFLVFWWGVFPLHSAPPSWSPDASVNIGVNTPEGKSAEPCGFCGHYLTLTLELLDMAFYKLPTERDQECVCLCVCVIEGWRSCSADNNSVRITVETFPT